MSMIQGSDIDQQDKIAMILSDPMFPSSEDASDPFTKSAIDMLEIRHDGARVRTNTESTATSDDCTTLID